MPEYFDLTLSEWERYATEACYAVDQNIKSQAERLFFNLSENSNASIIMLLINAGSDTLVFVVFSYLTKYPHSFAKNMQNVTFLVQSVASWQFEAFTLIRNNHPPFEKYVTRTIMTSLGVFLKILYENPQTSKELHVFLDNLSSNFFKLYLFKSFVDAVEVVDYDMGYMKYRVMIYSFQDNVIPIICNTLLPYFYNIEEGALINELSFMQENLNVSDSYERTTTGQVPITSYQEQQSDYVFMLLQKIVQFNYNITYSEYESDTPIDTCLITFPDKVSEKILNHQFLDALFFIIEKVSAVKEGKRKHEYLEISLNCVAKLMQSRMTYLDTNVKESYVLHAVNGLAHLLIKCRQIGSEVLLQGILLCNKRFYMNCQLASLKSICFRQTNSYDLYNNYIRDLTNTIVMVVSNSSIYVENHLLQEAIELANKILTSYGYKQEENMDGENIFFSNFTRQMINAFINNLAQPASLFQQSKILSILQSKPMINQLFQYFKKIASANYEFFFEKIMEKVDQFLNSCQNSVLVFANLLYLLSEIIDHNYLDRNIFLEKAKDRDYCMLGGIVAKVTQMIKLYIDGRSQMSGEDAFYTDTAVVTFIQAISIQFLTGFDSGERLKIKQRLYLFMMYGQFYNQYCQLDDDKSEETIMAYFSSFTEYLKYAASSKELEPIVQYVLNTIQKCIFKLKWHMKRQLYLKTEIMRFLSSFIEEFFYNCNYICDVRSRIAKILVTLTFDDVMDQYKFRINKFLNILKTQPVQLMHYDLIGIFEGVQTHAISKYFYNRLKKQIDISIVIANLFENAKNRHNQKSYGDLCKLIRMILNNKGFKISNGVISYEVFKLLLPYLIALLREMNKSSVIDMGIWQSSICEIMEIFKGIVSGTHINIFLLEQSTQQLGVQTSISRLFISELMKTIIIMSKNLEVFPEMEQMVLGILGDVNKTLLDYIFGDSSGKMVEIYAHLHAMTIDLTISFIKKIINGNKVLEDKLVNAFDCLRMFYAYFSRKLKVTHRHIQINNMKRFYSLTENFPSAIGTNNKNSQLISFVVSFILTGYKHSLSILKSVTRLIFELNRIFNSQIRALVSAQLREEKLSVIQDILNPQDVISEEDFLEKMKNWIKDIDIFV